ncbi:MAG: hypothetical protein E6Q68_07565 [Polynucleobacter sp.]|nr:MAG: hypothetical protein E6Q68_07565 [Polynucleobacter sp.]
MYEYFTDPDTVARPSLHISRSGLLRHWGNYHIDKIKEYYNNHTGYVKNEHLLVRFIKSFPVPLMSNDERYYMNVMAAGLDHSMLMRMTSSIYNGRIFKGVFYNPEDSEILIAHDTEFNFVEVNKRWAEVSAITVLRHPRSDLDLPLLDGETVSVEKGTSVILLNIPLLMCQWRAFRLEQIRKYEAGESSGILGAHHFIKMFVLPSMLGSHMEIALINRYRNILYGKTNNSIGRSHPFVLPPIDNLATDVQTRTIEAMTKGNFTMRQVMNGLTAITEPNFNIYYILPKLLATNQVQWALEFSIMKVIELLFDLVNRSHGNSSQTQKNALRAMYRAMRSNKRFSAMLTPSDYSETVGLVDKLLRNEIQ